jgi:CxxC-x17-CxxC domain-containing protein
VNYQDKILRCRDCGNEFLFSAGEQEFFASKGYVNDPRRCPTCRAAFRARQVATGTELSGRPAREMHPAVCAQCGAPTQVPFLPRLDKPVYCSTCFDQVRAAR